MLHNGVAHLQKKLNQQQGILISGFYNILYLTGFKTSDPHQHEAHLLITKNSATLFTDKRYSPEFESVVFYSSQRPFPEELHNVLKKEKIEQLAIETHMLTGLECEMIIEKNANVLISASSYIVEGLRLKKTQEEIKKIKQACEIADQCLSEVTKIIQVGKTEREIAFHIEFWIKSYGYDISFYPIVAIDKNSAIPHYDSQQGSGVVKKNSLILIDLGVRYNDYCSDITRMFIKGTASKLQLETYQKLLDVQEKTIKRVEKLRDAKDIDTYCRSFIQKKGLKHFLHSAGHGVGLEIHEAPYISSRSKDTVQNGNVFTIEPGIYYKNKFGMRIEDTLTVHKNKVEVLTRFPKALTKI